MNNSLTHKRLTRRRGASAIEAAMVLPMVILMLFGILEYGRYLMTLQVMTNAAREGARYALTHSQPVTVASVTKNNTTTDVLNVITKALGGKTYLQSQTLQIYTADSVGNNIGNWNDAQVGESICVRISGNYRTITGGMLFLPATIPVVAQAVMRSESN